MSDDSESAFSLFITNEMLENICKYTNKEGRQVQGYQDITVPELKRYIGLALLAGVYRGKHESIRALWSEVHGRPIFSETMARNRFSMITRCLRFDDKERRT